MAVLKCKMCGGNLVQNGSVYVCEFCKTTEEVCTVQNAKQNLLNRMNICLENENFNDIKKCVDAILNIDAECGVAYLGREMVSHQVSTIKDLAKAHFDLVSKYDDYIFKDFELAKKYDNGKWIEEYDAEIENLKLEVIKNLQEINDKRLELEPFSKLISTSKNRTCCVKSNGAIFNTSSDTKDWRNIIAVASGDSFTVGLTKNGKVLACGVNTYGQINVSDWNNIIAISAGLRHTVGLKSDGTVVATGESADCRLNVSEWKDIIAIAAGNRFTAGLRSDGTVITTNNNKNAGQWRNIVAISAGTEIAGLTNDGKIVHTYNTYHDVWDRYDDEDWVDFVAVACGDSHIAGLKKDGTVETNSRFKDFYQNGNTYSWTDVIAISASNSHLIGLKKDGTILTIGKNDFGQLNVNEWKLFDNLSNIEAERKEKSQSLFEEDMKIQKRVQSWKDSNLCQHCGSKFKGLFTKVCSNCGKKKDY